MNKKISFALLLLPLSVFLQNCIDHGSGGGSSTDNIVLYSAKAITETDANDGTFDTTITATVKGTKFSPTLTSGTDYDATNLPDGLSLAVTRVSDTQVSIRFSGQASKHSFCGDGQMAFYFTSSAFEDGKLPISFEIPVAVKYISPALTFSGSTLTENNVNNGTIPGSITATISNGGSFAKSSGTYVKDTDYVWSDLPPGLTPVVTANSTTQVTLTLTGTGTNHTPAYDAVSKIKFKSSALSSDVCALSASKNISVEFYRSVLLYTTAPINGDLRETNVSARFNADVRCTGSKPSLPADYDAVRAFISISAGDDIASMPAAYGIPTNKIIETNNSSQIASTWAGMLDGTINRSLDMGNLFPATMSYWTGSLGDGTVSADTCNGWTSSDSGDSGNMGLSSSTTGNWLNDDTDTCDLLHNILCVAYVSE